MTTFINSDIQHISNYINQVIRSSTTYQPYFFQYSDDIYNETLFYLNVTFSDPIYSFEWSDVETYGDDAIAYWIYQNVELSIPEIKDRFAAIEANVADLQSRVTVLEGA